MDGDGQKSKVKAWARIETVNKRQNTKDISMVNQCNLCQKKGKRCQGVETWRVNNRHPLYLGGLRDLRDIRLQGEFVNYPQPEG